MAVQTLPTQANPRTASVLAEGTTHPDHHLWRNGRLWWVAFTVHLPNWQKERVRLSLGTDDLEEARRRRDQVLHDYPQATGCQLSLRLDPPRGRRYGSTLWNTGDAGHAA
jgi:hypothetical protein